MLSSGSVWCICCPAPYRYNRQRVPEIRRHLGWTDAWGTRSNLSSAAPNTPGAPGGTRSPSLPCRTRSGMLPTALTTMGTLAAIVSRTISGEPSVNEGNHEQLDERPSVRPTPEKVDPLLQG